jgi:hypothetical protein
MSNAGLLIGWSRSVHGKEQASLAKFGEFTGYVAKLQAEKHIESFEPVLIRPHGGDLNGFFLVRGDATKLAALRQTEHWKEWETWGSLFLEGFGVTDCMLGGEVADAIARMGKVVAGR